ncbi:thiamine pyrophosphate-dependent enzyme [Mycobacteroides franklinii]|uniref:Putative thiamine pyrophosphate-containing protein YdaP n=1 Tax=Mycobacteroides franklinii TaxID=948102 RepID=A0A4R8QTH5_9MYCO|nr:thiamine pyrophosphate-dependent enzyme [Mycobacteroides franklinii]ORA64521.1 pyruvate oxidase [Mycobacteroides franklinii]TDH22756.1 thiamine pyrophosphate-binding protein [Mycobacteroides franklinii]TDZ44428.1 putative thiamine pyrophosphate-containing protein YdaP [Mycobacteroides franklinii]TDZ47315.1 putative thiamine pyrophosphate-containing protein YdaP [Mycobacteroides franklinii]TDZ57981.1 putative thiamine pyrophosphate-containing protein YdaP [Mycobacteroides franklinii]
MSEHELVWHKAVDRDALDEGEVTVCPVGLKSVALTRLHGRFGAIDNRCPHQGGPLGQGTLENDKIRCPWHGFDFDPFTGEAAGGPDFNVRTYPVEVREDGVYVGTAPPAPHVRTVSDVLVETMTNWGVDTVFGMVGHSNLGVAEAMHRAESEGKLRYFGIRHEGAAAFAASAYGKLTGRPAACFGIAGPGSTNLLTGLYDAKADRAPVLAISGNVDSSVAGKGAFQDIDLLAAFSDVSVYSAMVRAGSDHAELMTMALKHAILERGVGHLVLPDEVQVLPNPDAPASGPHGRMPDPRVGPPAAALAEALDLIESATRPVIVVGAGAKFDMPSIIALGERLNAPILTTFKAKGQISERHPLAAGVLGRSGTPVASWMMNKADLLLVFGASFSNHTGISPYKPTVQVDTDPLALGRFRPVTVPVLGDVGVTAAALSDGLRPNSSLADQGPELAQRWTVWRAEKARRAASPAYRRVPAAAIFHELNELTPENAVLTVDVGNHAYSFGRYFEPTGQSVLMSGYLGSIGFGFPAAMGAWAAAPDRPIIAVTGDGGFGQYLADFTTAVKYDMNITHILLNNGELAKISEEQRSSEYTVWQTSLHNPDFAAFARDCGAYGKRVTDTAELNSVIGEALSHPGPALVEILTDPRSH